MQFVSKAGLGTLVFAGCLLTGCDEIAGLRGDKGDERTAAGEVRGGTISDDMLPTDVLRSQNPPFREGEAASGGATEPDEEPSGDSSGEEEEATGETEPASPDTSDSATD